MIQCGGAVAVAEGNILELNVTLHLAHLALLHAVCGDVYKRQDFEVHYGKRANKRRKMYNGMIPCQLYMYYNAPKTEKMAKPMPKSCLLYTSARRFEQVDPLPLELLPADSMLREFYGSRT